MGGRAGCAQTLVVAVDWVVLDVPILTEEVIAYLLAVPKPVPKVNWRQSLLEQTEVGYTMKGKLDLDDLPATEPREGVGSAFVAT